MNKAQIEEKLMNMNHNVAKVTLTLTNGEVVEKELTGRDHLIYGVVTVEEVRENGYGSSTDGRIEANGIIIKDFMKTMKEEMVKDSLPEGLNELIEALAKRLAEEE